MKLSLRLRRLGEKQSKTGSLGIEPQKYVLLIFNKQPWLFNRRRGNLSINGASTTGNLSGKRKLTLDLNLTQYTIVNSIWVMDLTSKIKLKKIFLKKTQEQIFGNIG